MSIHRDSGVFDETRGFGGEHRHLYRQYLHAWESESPADLRRKAPPE